MSTTIIGNRGTMTEPVEAGLAQTIRGLRRELTAALNEPDDGIVFQLGPSEIELHVTVTKDASADSGVRLGVISIGGKAGLAREAMHRILLHLEPMVWETDSKDGSRRLVPAVVRTTLDAEPT